MKQSNLRRDLYRLHSHYSNFRPLPRCFPPPDNWRRNLVWDRSLNWFRVKLFCYCEEFANPAWNLLTCLQTQTTVTFTSINYHSNSALEHWMLLPSNTKHFSHSSYIYYNWLLKSHIQLPRKNSADFIFPTIFLFRRCFFSLYSNISITANCCIAVSIFFSYILYDVPFCFSLVVCTCLRLERGISVKFFLIKKTCKDFNTPVVWARPKRKLFESFSTI